MCRPSKAFINKIYCIATEWASYMTDETKQSRRDRWRSLNFAGTIDWAVDLQQFSEDDGCPAGTCDSPGTLYVGPQIFTDKNPTIECNGPCQLILPPFILPKPTTVTFPPITTSLEVAWTETTVVTKDNTVTTQSSISRIVQTTTITIPPVTTTAIEFWNKPVSSATNSTIIWLTWSISPSPFIITNDPNPEHKTGVTHSKVTRTIFPPPWPWSVPKPGSQTTSPTPIITHGSSTLHQTVTVKTQTGEPGPRCTSNCGHKCKLFCNAPCLPGLCPPGGGDPSHNDFRDPSDPNPPPGPPPGSNPKPAGGGSDVCQPSVKTDTGMCSNGNFPVWDPSSMSVRCDLSGADADARKTECQKEVDKDLEKSKENADQSSECCSKPKVSMADLADLAGSLKLQAAGNSCPVPQNFRQNPPSNGIAHATFTCDFNKWPNVCANARSAILKRGKTAILTYSAGGGVHANELWYHSKVRSNTYGWTLDGCDVEEYPFASGDPIRNPNPRPGNAKNWRRWDQERVLRLIPAGENREHGNALAEFYRDAGNGNSQNADGLIYSMLFTNHPTGLSDSDFYLGSDTSRNLCAQPYGNAFILVNGAANMAANERSYDPWWDNKLIHKTVSYFLNAQKTATSSKVTDIPSQYCRYPSPGRGVYNEAARRWEVANAANAEQRKQGNNYYKCDNYPGYMGPNGLPPTKRRRAVRPQGIEELSLRPVEINTTHLNIDQNVGLAANISAVTSISLESKSHMPRAVGMGSGSFLDPSAWLYLCDASEDDTDPCADNYSCGTDPSGDGADDDGSWGDSPSPSTTSKPTSTNRPTSTKQPPTTTSQSSCDYWQAAFMFVCTSPPNSYR
jgi:hypothetical protein